MFKLAASVVVICVFHTLFLFPNHGTSASRILALALMVTPSHKITFEPLLEELARRGHEVTVVSPIPAKKTVKNLREIWTVDLKTVLEMPNIFEINSRGGRVRPLQVLDNFINVCLKSLTLPQLHALKAEEFDLIILPTFNECGGAFAASFFDAPTILISPLSVLSYITSFYGNPSPPSFSPFICTGFTEYMTFYQRLVNFLTEGYVRAMIYYVAFPSMARKYREILNDSTLLSPGEVIQRSSLILSNSHFSISGHRPFLPNIIEVGGMHCRPAEALPTDLENFVNSSGSDGFIIFSMGSALKASNMPQDKRLLIMRTFSRLKQKVIWKWDEEGMSDLPQNVKLSKWLPQQDLLGHPKIKLFITHGGFGSTTEAIYNGVPVVGLPMFSDQEMNMKASVDAGVGISLDFIELTQESFLNAIHKVLNNPIYKTNIMSLSKIFRDQLEKPLDRAVFWTEYVIRHKGAPHLKSAGMDLNFFEYHSLDVIALLISGIGSTLFATFLMMRCTVRTFCNFRSKPNKTKHKKKKMK